MTYRYSLALRVIHWVTVFVVTGQVLLAGLNALLYEPRPILAEALVQAHLSMGFVVFILTCVRLAVRWQSPAPPPSTLASLRIGAAIVHSLLYIVLLLMPVTGYLRLATLGFEIRYFGLFSLPDLTFDPALANFAAMAHSALALGLAGLVVLHILAALFHRRLDGIGVIPRMAIRLKY
ncbi:MAG: cytochrome b/b6 domain-containing protein [Pseudomonadota bacterium]